MSDRKILIIIIACYFLGVLLGYLFYNYYVIPNTSSPVEKYKIDDIREANKAIIIKIETLDSIKHVKSVEVKSLDNDSTLKLFYELISE